MQIAIAQIPSQVAAFEANSKRILNHYQTAARKGAALVLTPELSLCGYPPHDLVERIDFIDQNEQALLTLAKQVGDAALVVGHCQKNTAPQGKLAFNAVSVLRQGKIVFTQAKTLLPTYDIFDEARYFEAAPVIKLFEFDGKKIAFAVCEDLWSEEVFSGRKIYAESPMKTYQSLGAELVVSLSASPYEWGKSKRREEVHRKLAKDSGIPILYCNTVGATDEVLFDGQSFALDASGKTQFRLKPFEEELAFFEGKAVSETSEPQESEVLLKALVSGIREYFHETGFKKAVLGLSGGIDSAVVACLARLALGKEFVLGIAMPSQVSSSHSLADAEALARNLGIRFEVKPIKFLFSQFNRELSETRGGALAPIAAENLQARIRGSILMTYANHDHALTLATANKSELAMGYSTLYGDLIGAMAPIGDLFKTRVYELAKFINQKHPGWIPESSITKPPSAELRPNQRDDDSLPKYELLDPILSDYIEGNLDRSSLWKKYSDLKDPTLSRMGEDWLGKLLESVARAEYKRKQAPLVLRVSPKAFGLGRKLPVCQGLG